MTKVKFLNLLQIRKLELESKLDIDGSTQTLTDMLIQRCESGWSSNIRNVFDKYDNALTEMCKHRKKFTNDELDEVLKMLRLI